jgi:GNAT superfamily N-acetyltransferase
LESSIEISILGKADKKELAEVTDLFRGMYSEMEAQGLKVPLAADGARLWTSGVEKTIGRLSCLVVAVTEGRVIGFAHGTLRFLPDYLGGHLTGNITHIYLIPEKRGAGTASLLLDELEAWFRKKNVHSVDLQVIPGNEAGRKFWASSGYPVELIQHRKTSL